MLIEILRDVKNILDKYQIVFWLEHGTLLGAVREGKMIDGDYDIDIATLSLERIGLIGRELYGLGYDVYFSGSRLNFRKGDSHVSLYLYNCGIIPEHITRRRISKKNFIGKIIVYCFLRGLSTSYRDRVHRYTLKTRIVQMIKNIVRVVLSKRMYYLILLFGIKIDSLVSYNVNVPISYVDEFKEIDFYDMKVRIPVQSVDYLDHFYGKDWRVVDKNWHPWKSFYSLMKKYNEVVEKVGYSG